MMNASDATPGEASGPDVITTPHGIEIAIEAEATGRAPTGLAQVVLAEHSALLRAAREMGRRRVREYMLTALRALALLLLGGFVWSAATSRAVGPNWADPLKSLVDVAARRGEWRAARDLHDRATPLAPHWSALAQARRRAATELAAVVDA